MSVFLDRNLGWPFGGIVAEADMAGGSILNLNRIRGLSGGGSSSPVVETMSSVGTSTTTSGTITIPSGVQENDLIFIAHHEFDVSSGNPLITPSGFSLIQSRTQTWFRGSFHWKQADGTEGGTTRSVQNGAQGDSAVCLVLRGDAPVVTATRLGTTGIGLTADDPGNITITASGATLPALVVCAYFCGNIPDTDGLSPNSTWRVRQGSGNSSGAGIRAHFIAADETAENYTGSIGDENSGNGMAGCYFNLSAE